MQFEHGQKQIWLVWGYLGSILGLTGLPWAQMCGSVHSDTNKEGGHDVDIPWEILGQDDPILCYLSKDKGQSGQCECILAHFLGLRGLIQAQMCGTVYLDTNKEGRHNIDIPWKILGQDVPFLCYLSMDQVKSGQFWCIQACFLGLRGAPMDPNVCYGPLGHQQGRQT